LAENLSIASPLLTPAWPDRHAVAGNRPRVAFPYAEATRRARYAARQHKTDRRTRANDPDRTKGQRMSAIRAAARWAQLAAARLRARHADLAATSAGLCTDPTLAAVLGATPALSLPFLPAPATIVGWGDRPSGRRAARLAARTGARLLRVEDGFLRSARREDPALSLILDDVGLYYDASAPSRLEQLIAAGPADPARARRLLRAWRDHGLSKITRLPACTVTLPPRYVLVLDQLVGDASVSGGLAYPGTFDRMLQAARIEFPGLPIVLKTHPDTALRGRRSHFDPTRVPRVVAVTEACDPAPLIRGAEAVYTVTSQGGFEALLLGRPVRTFGMPFYAGWGLTTDDLAAPPRRGKATLEALAHAALIDYARYIDPDTLRPATVEATIARLARPKAATQAA
jgi:capsular polysaccharide export protein